MRDVVIVGGGLTGLSAAYELEKQHIPYTLIEVKRRTGGSIQTVRQDDFVMDGAAFAVDASIQHEPLIDELSLRDDLAEMSDSPGAVMFRHGTESLIQALMAKLTGPRLMRMAVSSIGELETGRYALCLENGVMLDAGSIILAAPARYTERMFYGYINDISARLRDFRYESIVRVSIAFAAPVQIESSQNIAFVQATAQSERVRPGHTLVQAGIRAESPAQVDEILKSFALPASVTRYVQNWPEADLIYAENHADTVAAIRAMLPPGVALVGSDYGVPQKPGVANLADRIAQGRQAARQMGEFLKGK